jgi:hypothetical protein
MLRIMVAQATKEFLMTYGWAIGVVLIAIGVLVVFGLSSPKFYLNSCKLKEPLRCVDSKVTESGVELAIANMAGMDLKNVSVSITGCSGKSDLANGSQTWIDGIQISLAGDNKITGCGNLTIGNNFKQSIRVDYITNRISHSSPGQISATVE